MSDLVGKIKSRGYWRVVIRPSDFKKDRIAELQTLKQIVTQSAVLLRGWDFPHIDAHNHIQSGLDSVQQEFEWSTHLESWRFYQSGQFVFFGSLSDDWLDQAFWGKPPEGWHIGDYLSVLDALFSFTEIFEFAARLAMTGADGEMMNIIISLHSLKNRQLRVESPTRAGFNYPRVCQIESFPQKISVSRQELIAEPKILAINAAKELFERFNWTPTVEVLRGMQEELKR